MNDKTIDYKIGLVALGLVYAYLLTGIGIALLFGAKTVSGFAALILTWPVVFIFFGGLPHG